MMLQTADTEAAQIAKGVVGIYEKFEKLRREKGVTIYRVAKETGVSSQTFYAWRRGEYKPGAEKLLRIAKYFCVPMEYFLEDGR